MKAGRGAPAAGNPGAALPELTALAAEVAAGKLSSHAALTPAPTAPDSVTCAAPWA